MSMNAIVQFIRNALCCAKDLKLYEDTFWWQANHTNAILDGISGGNLILPEPLDKTTPLEVIISITQLYAFLSTSVGGLTLIWNSVGKLRRIVFLLESRLNEGTANTEKKKTKNGALGKAANRIVNESLLQEAKSAIRGAFVGFLVAPIGVAFWWLFANSWHITETPWLGGLLGLIDALTVMEICLLPLLVFMIVDGLAYWNKYKQTQDWIRVVESGNTSLFKPDALKVTTYEIMAPDWVPFWESGSKSLTPAQESKQLDQEIATVEKTLAQWFPEDDADDANKKKDDNEKEEKIRKQAVEKTLQTMKDSLFGLSVKGYCEFFYFVVNSVAFYGYLMAIVAFYYPDDTAQPYYVQTLKFGYANAIADWTGNFAGDFMWTIEPIVILGSPFYLSYMQPSSSKKISAADDDKVKKE